MWTCSSYDFCPPNEAFVKICFNFWAAAKGVKIKVYPTIEKNPDSDLSERRRKVEINKTHNGQKPDWLF